jgi:hypothetical protein
MRVPALYVTVAATSAFAEFLSSTVLPETVDAFIFSLKVTATDTLFATPLAPFAGLTEVTVGGALSAGTTLSNTTSTQ